MKAIIVTKNFCFGILLLLILYGIVCLNLENGVELETVFHPSLVGGLIGIYIVTKSLYEIYTLDE